MPGFFSFRKINMDHSFIRQLQRTDINLYVVTEILEASEKTVYKESTKADGGFKAKFYATLSGKVWFFPPSFPHSYTHVLTGCFPSPGHQRERPMPSHPQGLYPGLQDHPAKN